MPLVSPPPACETARRMNRVLTSRLVTGAAAAVLLFFAAGVFLPATRSVERVATIGAWPATVFALVEDARRAAEWSPWVEHGELTFTGPDAGPGAAFAWTGDAPGSRRVVAAERGARVVAALELHGTSAVSRIELAPVEGGTHVTWRLELDYGNDLLARWGAVLRGDSLAGRQEAGLAALTTLAENLPRADFGDLAVESLVAQALPIAYRRIRTRADPAAVSRALGEAFFDVLAYLRRQGLSEAGPPIAVNRGFRGAELELDAAIPVASAPPAPAGGEAGIRFGRTYAGPAIRATHKGPYAGLAATHLKIAAWLAAYGIERNGDPWEVYVSDPARTPEAERVTLIYYPVARAGG